MSVSDSFRLQAKYLPGEYDGDTNLETQACRQHLCLFEMYLRT